MLLGICVVLTILFQDQASWIYNLQLEALQKKLTPWDRVEAAWLPGRAEQHLQ